MRTSKDICYLCRERKATKKNSHYIPKLFGKRIFTGTNPRHGLLFDKENVPKKVQDTPKDNFLFCPECELSFSIYETYCALRLNRYDDLSYRNIENFEHYKKGEFEYVSFKKLNIKIFSLLIYSIIWRASISSHIGFDEFKLNYKEEEKLRNKLNLFTSKTQDDLMNKIENFKVIQNHCHLIIRANKKMRTPHAGLYSKKIDENMYHLGVVDYSIFYFLDKTKIQSTINLIDNNRNEGFAIMGLVSPEKWKEFNYGIVEGLLN